MNTWTYNDNNWINNIKSDGTNWTKISKKDFGKWVYDANTNMPKPAMPTEKEMMEDIMPRVADEGFFMDMVAWLKKDAPKRLGSVLAELYRPPHAYTQAAAIAYDRLCETLYQVGFRASETLERRMILGPSNKWVVEYFKDFPVGSKE